MDRRLPALAALLLALPPLAAQDAAALPLRDRARAVQKEALRSLEAHRLLAELCREAPHRLAGSEGNARAMDWALRTMRRLGLANVRLEEVAVPRWVRGAVCEVSVREEGGDPAPLAALALGGSVGTGEDGIEAEVVEVRSFEHLRALGERARGRIVFFNRPFDATLPSTFTAYALAVDQRSRGAIEAARAGAVAAVLRSVTSMPDDVPHTGATHYEDEVPKIPFAALSVAAAERLHAALERDPAARLRLRQDCRQEGDVRAGNVVGEIAGREKPEEIVLAGAHLDAWDVGHGAHDDGAGCAHVLEAARLVLATGGPPRRTLRFVLFNNEENGLRGGRGYEERHRAELDRHVAAIESDAGGFSPRGFTVAGGRPVLDALEPMAALLGALDLGEVRPGHGGADISPLGPSGVPLLGLDVDDARYFDFHHSPKDTIDAVHPRELARGAAALAIMAFALAEADETLPRTAVPTSR